jgi:signal peptidase I
MNNSLKNVLAVLGILSSSYSLMAQNGALKVYTNSTIANEPNLKLNAKLLVSNLDNPKIGDFVCYRYKDEFSGKQIRVHKLCARENDTIEIRNGVVYLNGINIDQETDHNHYYRITRQEYENVKQKENLEEGKVVVEIDEINLNIILKDSIAEKYGLTSKRDIHKKGQANEPIASVFKQNWNKDNFGPLKIPKGKVFVLGDNRDNSEDSRYIGLINTSDILGVVILK